MWSPRDSTTAATWRFGSLVASAIDAINWLLVIAAAMGAVFFAMPPSPYSGARAWAEAACSGLEPDLRPVGLGGLSPADVIRRRPPAFPRRTFACGFSPQSVRLRLFHQNVRLRLHLPTPALVPERRRFRGLRPSGPRSPCDSQGKRTPPARRAYVAGKKCAQSTRGAVQTPIF